MMNPNLAKAVRAYKADTSPGIKSGTPDEIATWILWEEMWHKRYARESNRPTTPPSLLQRYQQAIYDAACEVRDTVFRGRNVKVYMTNLGGTWLAYLGGSKASISLGYDLGPRATRAKLFADADADAAQIPRVDRGLAQSITAIILRK